MSFEVVKASLPMFFSGLKLTLLYSFFGIAGSIFVGLILLGGAYMAEGFNESTACILRRFSPGTCVERSCTVGKHHFFDQGNVDFFRDRHSGADEYGA